MTKDFKKPRRDDERPSSRPHNQSSSGPAGERFSGSARPRPNRQSMDRSWEQGAAPNHADYRPRRTGPPSAPYNRQSSGGNRPWENDRRSERTPNGYSSQGPRPRSFDSRANGSHSDNFGDRQSRFNDRPARGYSERPEGGSSFRDNRRPYNQRPPFNDSGPRREYGSRPPFRDSGPRREYGSRPPTGDSGPRREYGSHPPTGGSGPRREYGSRPPFRDSGPRREYGSRPPSRDFQQGPSYQRRDFDDGYRPRRDFEQDSRPPRQFERDDRDRGRDQHRPARDFQSPGSENPRQQSRPPRPTEQRNDTSHQPAEGFQRRAFGAQFEGDYEHLSADEVSQQPPQPPQREPRSHQSYPDKRGPEAEERHVTRLPDGRVLKGPRPVQRKNARFWTDIADDTEAIVKEVKEPAQKKEAENELASEDEADTGSLESGGGETKARQKPRTRAASATTREKKAGAKKSAGPRARPSQRGFKWPAP